MILSNGSAKETLAAIAGCGAVVLPRGAIAAYGACLWEGGIDSWTRESQDGTTRCSCTHAQIRVCNTKQINIPFIWSFLITLVYNAKRILWDVRKRLMLTIDLSTTNFETFKCKDSNFLKSKILKKILKVANVWNLKISNTKKIFS